MEIQEDLSRMAMLNSWYGTTFKVRYLIFTGFEHLI